MRMGGMIAFLWVLATAMSSFAQPAPQTASACDVRNDPASFDKKVVKVRGAIDLSFEIFNLTSEGCNAPTVIWLAFGGDIATPTPSTVNDNNRTPGTELQVNGVRYPIAKDESLRRLLALLTTTTRAGKSVYEVTATLTGTFFAGDKATSGYDGRTYFRGYGHLGCCSLLIISKVEDLESTPPADLNLSGTAVTRDGKPAMGVRVINATGGCCQPQLQEAMTDEHGRFAFTDSGQILHFRRDDLRPTTIIVRQGDMNVRVVLKTSQGTDWIVPTCTAANDKENRVGFSAKVLVSKEVEREETGGDPNTLMFTPVKRPLISAISLQHEIGAWEPIDGAQYVTALSFRQRWIKDAAGHVVGIDTEGSWKKGHTWRSSTFFNRDVIGYSSESRGEDELFSHILNTVCVEE
jgi:hypothetical protein